MIFNHFLALYLLPRQGCRNPRQLLDGKCWQMEAKPNVSGCGQEHQRICYIQLLRHAWELLHPLFLILKCLLAEFSANQKKVLRDLLLGK